MEDISISSFAFWWFKKQQNASADDAMELFHGMVPFTSMSGKANGICNSSSLWNCHWLNQIHHVQSHNIERKWAWQQLLHCMSLAMPWFAMLGDCAPMHGDSVVGHTNWGSVERIQIPGAHVLPPHSLLWFPEMAAFNWRWWCHGNKWLFIAVGLKCQLSLIHLRIGRHLSIWCQSSDSLLPRWLKQHRGRKWGVRHKWLPIISICHDQQEIFAWHTCHARCITNSCLLLFCWQWALLCMWHVQLTRSTLILKSNFQVGCNQMEFWFPGILNHSLSLSPLLFPSFSSLSVQEAPEFSPVEITLFYAEFFTLPPHIACSRRRTDSQSPGQAIHPQCSPSFFRCFLFSLRCASPSTALPSICFPAFSFRTPIVAVIY